MEAVKKAILKELERGENCSIITIVDQLISYAYTARASDIHISPSRDSVDIRIRVDGVLRTILSVPKFFQETIISRIKVLAGLRTDEHRNPQDGRLHVSIESEIIDIRVSIVPTYHGENVVLRLLVDTAQEFTLEGLGFSEEDCDKIENAILKPTGMVLVTGPTGSGKTTTLYTLMKMLNRPQISITTIEDPIEYGMIGIRQIQVNHSTSLTFANGLRSILRQDPDIIMVGEIRDTETAGIAINTALTGHLLLSTIHTNDSATTLPRLLDMKIEPYLIASTVNIAIGQRLIRRICSSCKKERTLSGAEQKRISEVLPGVFDTKKLKLWKGKGCNACDHSGYRGRICLSEILVVNDDIRDAILRKASASEIKEIAKKNGMITIEDNAKEKVCQGVTSIEEALRVIYE
jgi:type II secretory ATPase GspE/PulE/Tfp pilus assembly ATPase PilB-like protein